MSFEENIMSKDKYGSIFLKIVEYNSLNNPLFYLEQIQSHDLFRPIMCGQKYLTDYNTHYSLKHCLYSYFY